jgi:glycosyltransferase involved in cell wall biosynthesis
MSLSVLIITRNEAENIRECLESVQWADEIVIVDALSEDNTVAIAREYTKNIFLRGWRGYSDQKNYGHSQCQSEWILSIDADERVSLSLHEEILNAISREENTAYRIYIRDYMFGKWIEHGSWPRQCHIRLYRKDKAHWHSEIHEKINVDGPVGILRYPIQHFSHTTVSKFLYKLNKYTDIEAQRWFTQKVKRSWLIVLLSVVREFLTQYIAYQGYKDGGHGFVLAVFKAFYLFVARVKLWELWYKHERGLLQ